VCYIHKNHSQSHLYFLLKKSNKKLKALKINNKKNTEKLNLLSDNDLKLHFKHLEIYLKHISSDDLDGEFNLKY
jgi:hypothetical protein